MAGAQASAVSVKSMFVVKHIGLKNVFILQQQRRLVDNRTFCIALIHNDALHLLRYAYVSVWFGSRL